LSAWPVSGPAATVTCAAPALDEIHVGSGNDAQLSSAPRSYLVARDRIRSSVLPGHEPGTLPVSPRDRPHRCAGSASW